MRRVEIIVNPAAGEDQAVLATINDALDGDDIVWDVRATHGAGDARRHAETAVRNGCDVVAVYGGDGTVSEAAAGLIGGDVPLAILPGGTGNVVAQELGVPLDLPLALQLLRDGHGEPRRMDALRIGDRISLLRIGFGADANVMRRATREEKNRLGWLAYVAAALREIHDGEPRPLELTLDRRHRRTDAVALVVANVGRLGRGGICFPASVDPFDGQLDLFVFRRSDPAALLAVGAKMFAGENGSHASLDDPDAVLLHARGRELSIETDGWPIQADGECLDRTPARVEVVPASVPILVPRVEAEAPSSAD